MNNVGCKAAKSFWTLGLLGIGLGLQLGLFAPSHSYASERMRLGDGDRLVQNRASVLPDQLRTRSEAEMRAYALQLVNQDRLARGLSPVIPDPVADRAAQSHAQDMLQRQFFDHSSPEGLKTRQRYSNQGGGSVAMIGENIFFVENQTLKGLTFDLAEYLQKGWMHSPGHREIILTKDFQGFGYGIAYAPTGKVYAVQVFTTGAGLRRIR